MATIVSATECTVYFPISASAGTILAKKLIEVVEQRIPMILNNYFTNDEISVHTTAIFNATARSITIDQTSWEEFGFQAGDSMFIYRSFRNDQYCQIASLSGNVAVLSSAYSVVNESYTNNLGKAILFSLVKWPIDVQMVAAEMVYFDSDIRGKKAPNLSSRSLGPLSESYTGMDQNEFGYPKEIISKLDQYRMARLS